MIGSNVQVYGLDETLKNIASVNSALSGDQLMGGMRDATLLVSGSAKENAPVDTGRYRSSITPDVRVDQENVIQGVVGTPVFYAPFIELGTRAHWPPIAALAVWAMRHDMSAFQAARAISLKGMKAYKVLESALMSNQSAIVRLLDLKTNDITTKYG